MSTKLTDTCLAKCADDEPIFVLRAQDKFAADIVREWAARVANERGWSHSKVTEAEELARKMEEWPNRKVPD